MSNEQFASSGFALFPAVLSPAECQRLTRHVSDLACARAGTRCLLHQPWCAELADRLRQHPSLSPLLPASHVAVQCTYFLKSAEVNWLVAVHQDTAIPVAQRCHHPDLRGWSVKEGIQYVQPPPQLLEQLIALRVHLDPCRLEDGPLRVVPGSHLDGIIPPSQAVEARLAEVLCLAEPGDVLAMRPLLLHASSKSTGESQRRVLHFLFGPSQLPYGLSWLVAV